MNSVLPLVSVVMPAYNAERYIGRAIESVLSQSLKNLECIIINDGSEDRTEHIAEKYLQIDDRVKLHTQVNRGIIDSLNFGIEVARGQIIARMDADDICLPGRLDAQVSWMEKTNADVVGGSIQPFFGPFKFTKHFYESNEANHIQLLFNSCFAHPATVMRKEVFSQSSYEHADQYVEDYGLWCRLAGDGCRFTNARETVLRYRKHASQVTSKLSSKQNDARSLVAEKYRAQRFQEALDKRCHGLMMSRGELLEGNEISDALEALIGFAKETGDPERVISNNAFLFLARHAEFGPQRLRAYLNYFDFTSTQKSILEKLAFWKVDQSTRIFKLIKKMM